MTSARSCELRMRFGIWWCGVSNATLSAVPDMPLMFAMSLKLGADVFFDASPRATPWHVEQIR